MNFEVNQLDPLRKYTQTQWRQPLQIRIIMAENIARTEYMATSAKEQGTMISSQAKEEEEPKAFL